LDASLPKIVEFLSSSSIRVRLLTNGYHIGGDLLEALRSCAACEVVVGLKTPDPVKHLKYTGKPLAPVLQNVKRLLGAGIKVSFETVLIPGLNGVREVEELARIIGEMAGRAVLVIDPLVPVPGVQWRRPSDEEVREAVERASRYVEAKTHTAGGRASRAVVVFPRKQYLNMGQ
ncbi:MAG: radical SAM protein, partial [Thermoproteus sp.]